MNEAWSTAVQDRLAKDLDLSFHRTGLTWRRIGWRRAPGAGRSWSGGRSFRVDDVQLHHSLQHRTSAAVFPPPTANPPILNPDGGARQEEASSARAHLALPLEFFLRCLCQRPLQRVQHQQLPLQSIRGRGRKSAERGGVERASVSVCMSTLDRNVKRQRCWRRAHLDRHGFLQRILVFLGDHSLQQQIRLCLMSFPSANPAELPRQRSEPPEGGAEHHPDRGRGAEGGRLV